MCDNSALLRSKLLRNNAVVSGTADSPLFVLKNYLTAKMESEYFGHFFDKNEDRRCHLQTLNNTTTVKAFTSNINGICFTENNKNNNTCNNNNDYNNCQEALEVEIMWA